MAGVKDQWVDRSYNNGYGYAQNYEKTKSYAVDEGEHDRLVDDFASRYGVDRDLLKDATYVLRGKLLPFGQGYIDLLARITYKQCGCILTFKQPLFSVLDLKYLIFIQPKIKKYILGYKRREDVNPELLIDGAIESGNGTDYASRYEEYFPLPREWIDEYYRRPELFEDCDFDLMIRKSQPMITKLKLCYQVKNVDTGAMEPENYEIYEPDYKKSDIGKTNTALHDYLTTVCITRAKVKCYETFLGSTRSAALKVGALSSLTAVEDPVEQELRAEIERGESTRESIGNFTPTVTPILGLEKGEVKAITDSELERLAKIQIEQVKELAASKAKKESDNFFDPDPSDVIL